MCSSNIWHIISQITTGRTYISARVMLISIRRSEIGLANLSRSSQLGLSARNSAAIYFARRLYNLALRIIPPAPAMLAAAALGVPIQIKMCSPKNPPVAVIVSCQILPAPHNCARSTLCRRSKKIPHQNHDRDCFLPAHIQIQSQHKSHM